MQFYELIKNSSIFAIQNLKKNNLKGGAKIC